MRWSLLHSYCMPLRAKASRTLHAHEVVECHTVTHHMHHTSRVTTEGRGPGVQDASVTVDLTLASWLLHCEHCFYYYTKEHEANLCDERSKERTWNPPGHQWLILVGPSLMSECEIYFSRPYKTRRATRLDPSFFHSHHHHRSTTAVGDDCPG
jgi:hypothetical protein